MSFATEKFPKHVIVIIFQIAKRSNFCFEFIMSRLGRMRRINPPGVFKIASFTPKAPHYFDSYTSCPVKYIIRDLNTNEYV